MFYPDQIMWFMIEQGKGFESENYPRLQSDECDRDFNGNNIECNTGLKKNGLCLVPFSMLVNYYG